MFSTCSLERLAVLLSYKRTYVFKSETTGEHLGGQDALMLQVENRPCREKGGGSAEFWPVCVQAGVSPLSQVRAGGAFLGEQAGLGRRRGASAETLA